MWVTDRIGKKELNSFVYAGLGILVLCLHQGLVSDPIQVAVYYLKMLADYIEYAQRVFKPATFFVWQELSYGIVSDLEKKHVLVVWNQLYHIVIDDCQNVKVQGVTIFASGHSPNTDGIHVQSSIDITISSSNIAAGDDYISIGSGTKYLWIQDITCGPGHCISIGSLGKTLHEAKVHNVTVQTSTFINIDNGVRIKSWGRPSDGFVSDVVFQHLTMENAQNPIIIDQKYCSNHKDCPGEVSGVRISNVTYDDIHGSSTTSIAVKFDCSPKHRCLGIKLKNIKLTHKNKQASSFCNNCEGSTFGNVQPKSCFN
uniref:Polygalacturonase n=1 Tax=Chenopodium quinoa TaxID=63459 RepID=A0A803M8G7_CHEQI